MFSTVHEDICQYYITTNSGIIKNENYTQFTVCRFKKISLKNIVKSIAVFLKFSLAINKDFNRDFGIMSAILCITLACATVIRVDTSDVQSLVVQSHSIRTCVQSRVP